jgi:prepilin-type N-terminal cleavage/methylation domain-containing protein/prepilin-type processing-associated H-X9-DG protein
MRPNLPQYPDAVRQGFTLVELLVVIGIIALLIGILLPVIGRARRQAGQAEELAAGRQLMIAYLAYTTDNRGALMPGRIDVSLYPGMKVPDDRGQELTPVEVANRWPWRLTAYIDYGLRGTVLVNERATALADRDQPNWTYSVSVFPSFGMNLYNIGGDLQAPLQNHPGYLKRITQARHSSSLLVFASARADAARHGYFVVRPPVYKMITWTEPQQWPTHLYREADDAAAWGQVHPRWNGRAVAAFLDGHAEALPIDDLRDMRLWSERAARAGDANFVPQ